MFASFFFFFSFSYSSALYVPFTAFCRLGAVFKQPRRRSLSRLQCRRQRWIQNWTRTLALQPPPQCLPPDIAWPRSGVFVDAPATYTTNITSAMIRSLLIIQLLWAPPLHKEKWERRSLPPSTNSTMIRSSLIIPLPWDGSRSESLHLSWSWLMGPLLDHSWCQTGLKEGDPWSPFLFTLVVQAMGTFVVKDWRLKISG